MRLEDFGQTVVRTTAIADRLTSVARSLRGTRQHHGEDAVDRLLVTVMSEQSVIKPENPVWLDLDGADVAGVDWPPLVGRGRPRASMLGQLLLLPLSISTLSAKRRRTRFDSTAPTPMSTHASEPRWVGDAAAVFGLFAESRDLASCSHFASQDSP